MNRNHEAREWKTVKRMKLVRIILTAAVVVLAALAIAFIWIFADNTELRIVITVCIALTVIIFLILDKVHMRYLDEVMIQLSNLLDELTDMKKDIQISDTEDTLLSKLQAQMTRLSDILQAQNAEISDERDKIKSLISDIAHQMKTPVATVKLYGDLLSDNQCTDHERMEYVGELLSSLDRLCFLTDSMIKMSRLESGIIHVTMKSNAINDIIYSAVRTVCKMATDKNVDIIFKPVKDIYGMLDFNWTSEAIVNILDNAIKYSGDNGTIKITVEQYDMYMRISIEDNGPGIPEEEFGSIFERFYRGRDSRDIEGIGIGLYFTKRIVMEQGGYIKVESDGQSGSRFSIFLRSEGTSQICIMG